MEEDKERVLHISGDGDELRAHWTPEGDVGLAWYVKEDDGDLYPDNHNSLRVPKAAFEALLDMLTRERF